MVAPGQLDLPGFRRILLRRPWPERLINEGGGGGFINAKSTLARVLPDSDDSARMIAHAAEQRCRVRDPGDVKSKWRSCKAGFEGGELMTWRSGEKAASEVRGLRRKNHRV